MKFNSSFNSKLLQTWNFLLQHWILISCYIIITLANIQLRREIPTLVGTYSPHDDLLGVSLAKNILENNWLGDWNNLTLGKPPGYSLYLAVAKQIPIQLVVVNQLIICLISAMLVMVIRHSLLKMRKYSDIWGILVYSVIIFNPYLFTTEMSRVYRTSLHAILLLLFCTVFLGLLNEIKNHHFSSETNKSFQRKSRIWIVALSLNYFALIMLRSESYWILIPFLLVLGVIIAQRTIELRRPRRVGYLKMITSIFFTGLLVYCISISFFGQLNNTKYGTSLIENYYSGGFANAIKDWQRVENGKDSRPYVIVSRAQRLAVYEISTNAAKLSPWLELKPGEGWQIHPCNSPIRLCDNSGGWFTWQVRDAAISTGEIKNEIEFQKFFQQISVDIKAACQREQIKCGPNSVGVGVKSLRDLPIEKIVDYSIRNILSAFSLVFNLKGEVATPDQYGVGGEIIDTYHEVVNYRSEPPGSIFAPTYSESLRLLEKIYTPIQVLLLFLAFLGFILTWQKENRLLVYAVFAFGIIGIILVSLGVSVAQVSFGWRVEGPYLLPIQPILQFITLVGATSLISEKRKTTESKSSSKLS